MTILPSQVNSILRVYHRLASEKTQDEPSGPETKEREDVVTISQEAKRRQIQEQTRQEVVKRLRESLLSETR